MSGTACLVTPNKVQAASKQLEGSPRTPTEAAFQSATI